MNMIAIASIATASLAPLSAKSRLLLEQKNQNIALILKKQSLKRNYLGTDSLLQYFNQTTAELEKQVAAPI